MVAIVDIWSQMVLLPLHDRMFKFLRTAFSAVDGTFDQDKQRERIRRFTLTKKKLYSFDLSAATDRIPIWVQAVILLFLGFFNPLTMYCWVRLMSSRVFAYRKPIKYRPARRKRLEEALKAYGREVPKFTSYKPCRYAVGQPMGLYSS